MTLQQSLGFLDMVLVSPLENPFQLEGCMLAARTTWQFSLQGLLAVLSSWNALVASTPLTHASSPRICSELALGPLALLCFSVPPVLCSVGALTSALSLQPAPLNGWEASRHNGDTQLL